MMRQRWFLALPLLLLTGCTLGPKYKRPTVPVPESYRGDTTNPPGNASLGDEKWWAVFQDPQLQELIRQALAQNYDVRIAATRVLEAQAALGITRADQFPQITGGASVSNERFAKTTVTHPFNARPSQVNLALS